MLAQITGQVLEVAPDHAVVDCHGVGYLLFCPGRTLGGLVVGQQGRLFTVLNVREDALTLYGFADKTERQMFRLLTTVSGVGPKIGLSLLSSFSVAEITGAIFGNQPAVLARASGVGKRMAEKIIVELKDKLKNLPLAADVAPTAALPDVAQDVASALMNLGYQPKAAEAAASAALKEDAGAGFEELFRLALKKAA
ncbi:MAG: Holliday junction branch migration protein RuvA [Pseudomonadaceae bacterium]|nr:Holliday junction branch migration protein RuvA [Pseudomonadaceae bacterium]